MSAAPQNTTSPAFILASWAALLGGFAVFLLGLWNAEMELNEKGYYFAVLILGLFSAITIQKTVRDQQDNLPVTHIYIITCWVAFAIAVGLLCIGLWNAKLLLSEKGFYGVSFFLSLFGAIAVQKNTGDMANKRRAEGDDNEEAGSQFPTE
jgi:uncharacterized membrane protein YiaA